MMMARSGDHDLFVGDEPRKFRQVEHQGPVDGRWQMDTHWDLEAIDERGKVGNDRLRGGLEDQVRGVAEAFGKGSFAYIRW
jgi:hypothetical protein